LKKVVHEHNCGCEIMVELLGPAREVWFFDFIIKPRSSIEYTNIQLCPKCGHELKLKDMKPDPRFKKGVQ